MTKVMMKIKVAVVLLVSVAITGGVLTILGGGLPAKMDREPRGHNLSIYASHTQSGAVQVTWSVVSSLGQSDGSGGKPVWYHTPFVRRYGLQPGERVRVVINAGTATVGDTVTCAIAVDGETVSDDTATKTGDTPPPDVTCQKTVIGA